MTSRSPQRPNKSKPYKLIKLPQLQQNEQFLREKPVGHDTYKAQKVSGFVELKLLAKTPIFVASGVVVRGQDINPQHKNIPLVKLGINEESKLLIPSSSLKGAIRAAYEAITLSCLCKTVDSNKIPRAFRECSKKDNLCPACRVFGAMGWQGLIGFTDAVATDIKPSIGYMPSLYSPRNQRAAYFENDKVVGRKFYYHHTNAINKGNKGIPVQQVGVDSTFTTKLSFKNLTEAELGILLTVLGLSPRHDFALKIGGGKPIGMGTVKVAVERLVVLNNLRDRYLSYTEENFKIYQGEELSNFINQATQQAETQLIKQDQLNELKEVWQYPTNRQPYDGAY
jgi:CRISPR/Cas system CSM-associated protein Csm3 (group 7 of RAMP superfamily)